MHIRSLQGAAIEANATKYRNEIHAKLTDPTLAQTLFKELLAPIQDYAEKKDLVIVPDGQLHLLAILRIGEQGCIRTFVPHRGCCAIVYCIRNSDQAVGRKRETGNAVYRGGRLDSKFRQPQSDPARS